MSSLYIFLQWARPAWLLIIMASAVSVGLLLTVLSVLHGWLADQLFVLEEDDDTGIDMRSDGGVEIPVHFRTSDIA